MAELEVEVTGRLVLQQHGISLIGYLAPFIGLKGGGGFLVKQFI
jgi:hypothetical protein